MEHYAAIDLSLKWSRVCVVDSAGQIAREARVRSEREALVALFEQSGLRFARIRLEAGPLSQWLYAGLVEAGLPALLIETRHVKAAFRAMTIPGVGAVVAMTFKAAVDQPERFARSKAVGAHFGLTPKKYQSGEIDRTGRISKVATPWCGSRCSRRPT